MQKTNQPFILKFPFWWSHRMSNTDYLFTLTTIFFFLFHRDFKYNIINTTAFTLIVIFVDATIFSFDYLYLLFMIYICYQIDCCKCICFGIANRDFEFTSLELMKMTARLHANILK